MQSRVIKSQTFKFIIFFFITVKNNMAGMTLIEKFIIRYILQ